MLVALVIRLHLAVVATTALFLAELEKKITSSTARPVRMD